MGPSAGSEPEVKNVMNYLSNIKHNIYTIELRPKQEIPGFLLPSKEIIPCAEEIVAFHVVAAQQIIEEFTT